MTHLASLWHVVNHEEDEEIDDGEILRRINALYREASLSQALGRWKRLGDEEADLLKRARPTRKFVSRFAECRSSCLRRMWNSSAFMRTFRQHFTTSFNGRRDHRGTRGRAGGTGGERGACA